MRPTPWIPALLVAITLSGCGTTYHLPGHSEANHQSPPDIIMTQSETRRMLTTGLERPILSLPPSLGILSSNPEVVDIAGGDWTARLIAKRPGTARVYYDSFIRPTNHGFEVTVLPANR
jgi:hypothetical protein